MIIIDIETSGLDPNLHSILSLGAIDYDTLEEFYGECRLKRGDYFEQDALDVNGFKIEDIKSENKSKQTSEVLYIKFLQWRLNKGSLLSGQDIGRFDIQFLKELHKDIYTVFSEDFPFRRSIDLHTLAYKEFKESMSLEKICLKLGLYAEPKPHNALQGAKKIVECLKILL